MKTSKVILIITATIILILVVIFSLMLRHAIHIRRSAANHSTEIGPALNKSISTPKNLAVNFRHSLTSQKLIS